MSFNRLVRPFQLRGTSPGKLIPPDKPEDPEEPNSHKIGEDGSGKVLTTTYSHHVKCYSMHVETESEQRSTSDGGTEPFGGSDGPPGPASLDPPSGGGGVTTKP